MIAYSEIDRQYYFLSHIIVTGCFKWLVENFGILETPFKEV